MIRLYANISDTTYLENDESGASNVIGLQSENDNLKFRLIEKDGAVKSKDETINRLQIENAKLSTGQTQSRNVILALEQKLETSKIITHQNTDQVTQRNVFIDFFFYYSNAIHLTFDSDKTFEITFDGN